MVPVVGCQPVIPVQAVDAKAGGCEQGFKILRQQDGYFFGKLEGLIGIAVFDDDPFIEMFPVAPAGDGVDDIVDDLRFAGDQARHDICGVQVVERKDAAGSQGDVDHAKDVDVFARAV